MKKSLIFLTLLLAATLVLTSCADIFGSGQRQEEDDGDFNQIVNNDATIDISEVRTSVFDILGMMGTVDDTAAAEDREIVFGNTNRPITAAAAAALEEYVAGEDGADVGYIVYYDGKSVATYWQDSRLADLAVDDFIKECIKNSRLELSEGIVVVKTFTMKQLEQDVYWMAIEENAPADLYQALRALNSLYEGSKMCEWMANLYDDKYGGFYYAASSRDNEGYLPDLESTNQLTSWLQNNGAMTSVNDQFPNWLKAKIVKFAKDMQSDVDGYFYHPQWPQGREYLNNDRYGRDLSWGVAIIRRFYVDTNNDGIPERQHPYYCTPSGEKCELHYNTDESCSFANATASSVGGLSRVAEDSLSRVTASVQSSVSSAVSRIPSSGVSAVASKNPDYSSSAAFTAWLEEYCASIKTNSGAAHNINALQSVIIQKGYCDELLDFLDRNQQEVWDEQPEGARSGLWQYEPDYRFVWGILKYMPFYNDANYGRPIKHAKEIVASCMEVIMRPAGADSYAMNDLMNQFSSITAIITNVQTKYNDGNGDAKLVEEIREMLLKEGGDLVRNATEKLRPFKLNDGTGTFVYTQSGLAPAMIYGVPISLGLREGDVNGNSLCSSYYRGMFTVFGFKEVPLCNSADGERFLEIIETLEPVSKIPAPKPSTLDFDDLTDIEDLTGVTLDKKTDIGAIELAGDPEDASNNTLYFKSGIGAQYGDYLRFTATGTGGNCNIAEFDFLLERSSNTNTNLFQIKMGNAFMLVLGRSGNYLTLSYTTDTGSAAKSGILVGAEEKIKISEWNKIRVEMYDQEDGQDAPYIKIFVNDVLMAVTNAFYGSHAASAVYNSAFKQVQFYSMKAVETENYFDNIYFNRETKIFDEFGEDTSDARK